MHSPGMSVKVVSLVQMRSTNIFPGEKKALLQKQHVSDLLSNGIPLFALHLLPQSDRGSTADDAMHLHQILTNPLAKFSSPKSASTSK